MGCSGGMAADVDATETIELQVLCLTGEGVTLTVDKAMLGHEVRQMVSRQLSGKAGSKIVLTHLDAHLVLFPKPRTARYCWQNCYTGLYVRPNRSVSCMVLSSRASNTRSRVLIWKG